MYNGGSIKNNLSPLPRTRVSFILRLFWKMLGKNIELAPTPRESASVHPFTHTRTREASICSCRARHSGNAVFTTHIRRMREGNSFSLSTLAGGGGRKGGNPISNLGRGGVPHPRSRWGEGTPSQVWTGGGCPISGLKRGVPHSADRGYLIQDQDGGWRYPEVPLISRMG